jgi:hypothetical protein
MSAAGENASDLRPTSPGALRARRHRQRRRDGVRLVTVEVPEGVVREAIARALLKSEERPEPWTLIQACYASLLSDAALDWLTRNEVITGELRADAVAILRSISEWLERANR